MKKNIQIYGKIEVILYGSQMTHSEVEEVFKEGLRETVGKLKAQGVLNDCDFEVSRAPKLDNPKMASIDDRLK